MISPAGFPTHIAARPVTVHTAVNITWWSVSAFLSFFFPPPLFFLSLIYVLPVYRGVLKWCMERMGYIYIFLTSSILFRSFLSEPQGNPFYADTCLHLRGSLFSDNDQKAPCNLKNITSPSPFLSTKTLFFTDITSEIGFYKI